MIHDFYGKISNGKYPFIIAEIGANHNGDMSLAKKLIDEAKECGCNAVKFQSWTKHSLFSKKTYQEKNQFIDINFGNLEEMVEKFSLSERDHFELKDYCTKKDIIFFSTPTTIEEVDILNKLAVPFFKVASMDLNNLTLLDYVAKKNKTIILSTGMGTLAEIDNALNTIYNTGNKKVILLHCIAIYPPDDKIINLRNIEMFKKVFNIPIGFSDHTIGTSIPLAAISIGAVVIEKHFTLDKNMPGWDHTVSANPEEMKIIVQEGKRIVNALGSNIRNLSKEEIKQRESFRRSVVTKRKMRKGEILSLGDINFKRPGTGIRPDEINYIVGRKINKDIENDTMIKWEDID